MGIVVNLKSFVNKDSFKQTIRKFPKDFDKFSFKAPVVVIFLGL